MSNKNISCSNNAPEIDIFNLRRNQKLLLVANQFQDSTFLFEINSKDIGVSKLASQLSLLLSLFELQDNYTIVISSIIEKQSSGGVL